MNVVIVDGGGSNLGSVQYALERLEVRAPISSDPQRISDASHLVLPGVGTADIAMKRLRMKGLDRVLSDFRRPLLGVCLGMQLLFEYSEEGDTACLGILPGKVRRIPAMKDLRVPHMGWNVLRIEREDSLLTDIPPDAGYVYFVHSYAVPPNSHTVACSNYGDTWSAVVRHGNVCGMQFHPERSGVLGAQLLRNFLRL